MSKHEKYDDSRLDDENGNLSGEDGSEGLDDLEGADELLKTGLTAGKEVRIGLAVIVVLVIVLGAVVVKRMRRGAEPPAKPTAETEVATAERTEPGQGKEGTFRFDGPGFGSASRPGKPTVVAALSGPGPETKGKSSHNEPDTWAFASDNASKGRNKAEGRSSPLTSFMPKVTDAAPSERPGGVPLARPVGQAQDGWETDRDRGKSAGGPRAADPFQSRPSAADGRRGAELSGSAGPSAAGMHRADDAGRTTRAPGPLAPLAESRAPLAPSALNPLRGRDETAATRSGEPAAGARALNKAGAIPAAPDPRDQFAPRFGEAGNPEAPKAAAVAAGADLPGGRFAAPMRPAGSSSPAAGGFALRGDAASRPGDENARRPDGTYVVQPNDNYWTISQRLYGTDAYFQALAEHNRSKFPIADKLQAGDVIAAPTAAELERLYPQLCRTPAHREAFDTRARTAGASTRGSGAKVYVVQEGDTLYDIARYELGKPSRWGEIYELNKDVLGKQFDYLSPGMQLALPDSGPAVSQRTEPSPRR
jgi:nucleoid-associated protein YgaU